jgi:hypothetical protein
MRFTRNVEPHLAADLMVADDPAHARMKNLRAAAGKRIASFSFSSVSLVDSFAIRAK